MAANSINLFLLNHLSFLLRLNLSVSEVFSPCSPEGLLVFFFSYFDNTIKRSLWAPILNHVLLYVWGVKHDWEIGVGVVCLIYRLWLNLFLRLDFLPWFSRQLVFLNTPFWWHNRLCRLTSSRFSLLLVLENSLAFAGTGSPHTDFGASFLPWFRTIDIAFLGCICFLCYFTLIAKYRYRPLILI